jgi:hypothetical protein
MPITVMPPGRIRIAPDRVGFLRTGASPLPDHSKWTGGVNVPLTAESQTVFRRMVISHSLAPA